MLPPAALHPRKPAAPPMQCAAMDSRLHVPRAFVAPPIQAKIFQMPPRTQCVPQLATATCSARHSHLLVQACQCPRSQLATTPSVARHLAACVLLASSVTAAVCAGNASCATAFSTPALRALGPQIRSAVAATHLAAMAAPVPGHLLAKHVVWPLVACHVRLGTIAHSHPPLYLRTLPCVRACTSVRAQPPMLGCFLHRVRVYDVNMVHLADPLRARLARTERASGSPRLHAMVHVCTASTALLAAPGRMHSGATSRVTAAPALQTRTALRARQGTRPVPLGVCCAVPVENSTATRVHAKAALAPIRCSALPAPSVPMVSLACAVLGTSVLLDRRRHNRRRVVTPSTTALPGRPPEKPWALGFTRRQRPATRYGALGRPRAPLASPVMTAGLLRQPAPPMLRVHPTWAMGGVPLTLRETCPRSRLCGATKPRWVVAGWG